MSPELSVVVYGCVIVVGRVRVVVTGIVMLAVGSSVTVEGATVVDEFVVGAMVEVMFDVIGTVTFVDVALGALVVVEVAFTMGTSEVPVAFGNSEVDVTLAEGSAPDVVAFAAVAFVPEDPAVPFVLFAAHSIVRAGAAAWKAIAPFW